MKLILDQVVLLVKCDRRAISRQRPEFRVFVARCRWALQLGGTVLFVYLKICILGAWHRQVVLGYYQYHAVPGNANQLRVCRRVAKEEEDPPASLRSQSSNQ